MRLERLRRRGCGAGLALPVLFTLMALATFIGLGTWQLERKAWKEALIATLTERTSAPPVDLPASARLACVHAGR